MKLTVAALLVLSACLANAQEVSPNLSLSQYQSELSGFSSAFIAEAKRTTPDLAAVNSAKAAAGAEPALAALPMAKAATLNVLNQLAELAEARRKAELNFAAATAKNKNPMSPLSPDAWAEAERVKIEADWKARLNSAEKVIAQNQEILSRFADTAGGKAFALLGSSPLAAALTEGRTELVKAQQRKDEVAAAKRVHVRVIQVLDDGCLAIIPNGSDDFKRVFVQGMIGDDIAEGQKGYIRAKREGVFKYDTAEGGSSTVEKWVFVAAE